VLLSDAALKPKGTTTEARSVPPGPKPISPFLIPRISKTLAAAARRSLHVTGNRKVGPAYR